MQRARENPRTERGDPKGGRTLLVLALWFSAGFGGIAAPRSEYEVKAAMLYNFARFVDWPPQFLPEPPAPLVLGVLGPDPFGPILESTLRGVTVNGRPIEVRRFATLAELKICHILFISADAKSLPLVFETLEKSGVLTVGDTEKFARHGGVIGFTLNENKVHFEINLDAAERAGLKISSKLLKLATVTRNGG
jgi:YfiR/HmsC-like